MHRLRTKRVLVFSLVLCLMLCEVCFERQSFQMLTGGSMCSETISEVRSQTSEKNTVFLENRFQQRQEAEGVFRQTGRRMGNRFVRKTVTALSCVNCLPQIFHSSLFIQSSRVYCYLNGSIELIRCTYKKDGKK